MSDSPFEPPQVTDEDITWASRLLNLPVDAFYGDDGADPRQEVLKSTQHIDVAACPGSGKTTLLVAKLAILAKKWRYRTRGICVLSHTNVARNQIETGLGNTAAGQRLLSYPHYIGTIHGFVNDFLAVPWLRSQGYPIKMIDTEICEIRRWNKLAYKWRSALEKRHVDKSNIRILDTSFNLGKRDGKFLFAKHTDTYQNLSKACQETAREGYHCYDDLFIWAHDMINKLPYLVDVVRDRFPLLFVDEAQDNSEEQSAILHRIFIKGNGAVIRQRFGDENQAIFDSMGTKEATTDKFPDGRIKKEVPNSHRFGQKIADLADPLGLFPYGLKGQGPKQPLASEARHTIFLFDDDSANKVLDAYGELLIETFSEQELVDVKFVAVGQIHRPPDEEADQKSPHHIGHYWPEYDPELTRPDPKPKTFVQYVFVGMGRAQISGEAYLSVEKIAEGILRLAGMTEGRKTFAHRRHKHRYVLELLEECADVRGRYEDLIAKFSVKREALTKETWDNHCCGVVREVAETIAGASLSSPEASGFLAWKDEPDGPASPPVAQKSHDNIYRYPREDPRVHIRVGSIHSVKGETHTATLVVETFWQDKQKRHNLELLKPWLCGGKSGGLCIGVQQQSRLKLHYVAMTRPTHLLCLAMKRSIFQDGDGSLSQEMLQKLEQRGWRVKSI